MKKQIQLLGLLFAAAAFHCAASASDVGVSINIAQPGFYGRIDLGRVPAPVVIYSQPIIIEQWPAPVVREPIYLRVPPGHEKNWSKHCHRYNACGQPVYFVQDSWYRDVYAPRYYGGHQRGDEEDDGRQDEGHHRHKRSEPEDGYR